MWIGLNKQGLERALIVISTNREMDVLKEQSRLQLK